MNTKQLLSARIMLLVAAAALLAICCLGGCTTVRVQVQWEVSQTDGPEKSIALQFTSDLE